MDEQEFRWLVGILEGEGTFLAGPPSRPASPVVRVSMTDRDIVERVGRSFERAVIPLRARKAHHKTPYVTTIKGIPAAVLMLATRPYLGSARQVQWTRRSRPCDRTADGGAPQ